MDGSNIGRQLVYSQIAGVITWMVVAALAAKGLIVPDGVQIAITGLVGGGVGFVVGTFIPLAKRQIDALIHKHLTNEAIASAQNDPASPVDIAEIVDDETILRAQLNPTSPATVPEGETVKSLEDKLDAAVADKKDQPQFPGEPGQ